MAIYRFRVSFEDHDAVKEIDIKSNQTFEDLHQAIHQAINYKSEYPSSFYVSNDQWHKGEEFTIHPKLVTNVALMENAKLSRYVNDPHQKFYYTFNFDKPLDFHVELLKILDKDPAINYPVCVRSEGEAPKQFVVLPTEDLEEDGLLIGDLVLDDEVNLESEEYGIDSEDHETEQDGHNDEIEGTEGDGFGHSDSYDEEDFR